MKPQAVRSTLIQPLAGAASGSLLAALVVTAGDWPNYRGPAHNGTSPEPIRTNWSVEPPEALWRTPLDPALSSFTVQGGRVFTQVLRRDSSLRPSTREVCIALDAETGRELWAADVGRAVYGDYYANHLSGNEDGPRSTPTVAGERVIVLSSYLRLVCLSAATGSEIWSKDLVAEHEGRVIPYQNASSALIEGDLVLVNCNAARNSLLAFHTQDGTLAWVSERKFLATHASPVASTIAGVRQVIFYTQSGLVSVLPQNGHDLWQYPFAFNSLTAAASPVVGGDVVYCSATYGSGAGAVRI